MPNPDLRIPLCPSRVACDGNRLIKGRSMCSPCEKAIAKRTKPSKPLRGEHVIVTRVARGEE